MSSQSIPGRMYSTQQGKKEVSTPQACRSTSNPEKPTSTRTVLIVCKDVILTLTYAAVAIAIAIAIAVG